MADSPKLTSEGRWWSSGEPDFYRRLAGSRIVTCDGGGIKQLMGRALTAKAHFVLNYPNQKVSKGVVASNISNASTVSESYNAQWGPREGTHYEMFARKKKEKVVFGWETFGGKENGMRSPSGEVIEPSIRGKRKKVTVERGSHQVRGEKSRPDKKRKFGPPATPQKGSRARIGAGEREGASLFRKASMTGSRSF